MLTHMRSRHTTIWNAALQANAVALRQTQVVPTSEATSNATNSSPVPSGPPFNIDEFYWRVSRWIVTGSQPFSEVENQEFQELLTYLKPALDGHLLQAEAIQDCIFRHAGALCKSTKQYLSSLAGLMAISCNGWTSSNRITFLAITGSWITHDWRLEETLLDFVELHGAHDRQNMASAVASVLSKLGIGEKVLALVSNNAGTNGTLIRHLSALLEKSAPGTRWD
ncbi:hypothetical protein FRC09_008023 [Ceratobasidium sp. 395]|nr:hypothetical protein FRC09_008023 [Ceratobasidium sp. 395]